MKIIHINNSDIGGASRACIRLHKGLIKMGIDSRLCLGRSFGDVPKSFGISKKWHKINLALSPFIDYLPTLFYKSVNTNSHSYDFWPTGLVDEVIKQKPDIVHIHWIGSGLLRLEELKKIKCPIVWTLHDMWPMTGGEHVNYDTNRIIHGYLNNNRPIGEKGVDIDKWMWNRKYEVFRELKKVTFVAPSTFMTKLAKKSHMLRKLRVETIPNCLDKNIFKKNDKQIIRKILGLERDKKYILFGAYRATEDMNKGFDLLIKALTNFSRKDVELIVFGVSSLNVNVKIPVRCLGTISDEISLSLLYNASDLTVVPSRIESFGQVAMESLACGTPVVCFDVGGLKDIVIHNKNGYRAKEGNTNDLYQGMKRCLEGNFNISEDERFDSDLISKKYVNLYRDLRSK